MLDLELPMAFRRCCACFLALVMSTACAGSRSSIVADQASYPVSMSAFVRDPEGRVLDLSQLDVIGEFKFKYRSVHMLFTLIPLSRWHYDLSGVIDEQIERAGGEAIVDFSAQTYYSEWTMFCAILGLGVLPAYSDVAITGKIVRRR